MINCISINKLADAINNINRPEPRRWHIVGNDGCSWGDFSTLRAAETCLYDCYDDDTRNEYELEIMPEF